MGKIRVIELFAGYGSQHLALKRLKRDFPQFEYEVIAFCEIDKYAIKAYRALHGHNVPNIGDITKVSPLCIPNCDLMTWSFPCQSISCSGLQHGLAEGSGTHSSLCWDAIRIFKAKRPQYLLMENVSALVSNKFIKDFNMIQFSLQKLGYTNFVQLMNAKDYGVPQSRRRVFMVSILNCSHAYYFPEKKSLTCCMKDVLEKDVAEKYYLSDERATNLIQKIVLHDVTEPSIIQIGNIKDDSQRQFKNPQDGRVFSSNGLSPTINTCQGGQRVPIIVEGVRLRYLTEREIFRLMDVDEYDINTLLNAGISKTQLVKLAGNSIVVACMYYIFHALFIKTMPVAGSQLQLF